VGSCHHSMAHSQVADRGDGLLRWRVALTILKKQLQLGNWRLFSNLGIGQSPNYSLPQKLTTLWNISQSFGLGLILWNNICNVKWIDLAQYKSWWQVLVNAVMKLQVSKNVGNFFTNWETVSFSKIVCFMDLVGCLVCWLVSRSVCRSVGCSFGLSVGQSVGRSVIWSVDWLAG
jgi:hypothetical protein